MPTPFIQTLIPHLPRYAEEEGDFYAVSRTALVDALCQPPQVYDRAVAETVIALVEALFDTLAVLNTDYLQKGEWCFVSFPAQLLAMSLLTAWGDRNSRFFDAHFWNTQGIADAKKNQQLDILKAIESNRYQYHSQQAAQPIRYIHVAWGIIKIDGKILFYQREDTQKRHEKQAGDYGLVGGRLNQCDVSEQSAVHELLATVQSKASSMIKASLPKTLKREINEEIGLDFEEHYRFKPWRSLKPYQQIQGAAPNHALTQYHLEIFSLDLTLEGYLHLQQQLKVNERLVWFTLDEFAQEVTADGKKAYIKALLADFDNDASALKAELSVLPDSFTADYCVDKHKFGLTLLTDSDKPVLTGILGKEKPLAVLLSDRQIDLLLGLAAHNRCFEFMAPSVDIVFHPYGWVEVVNSPELREQLTDLAKKVKDTDVYIENHRDTLFRLSVNPKTVYFDETLFEFSVSQTELNSTKNKIPVYITRKSFTTAFGNTKKQQEEFNISLELANNLKQLSEKEFSSDNDYAVKIEDTCNKGLHKDPKFLSMGLRRLLRREVGIMKFCCQFELLRKNRILSDIN